MTPSKRELRASLKQARMELSNTEISNRSRIIIKQLKQVIDWSKIANLHYFKPIASLNEVDISSFILALKTEQPSLKIYTSHQIKNVWQIPDIKFDVIIVPMLGFDPQTLHRLGYGGGYYDKFLATQPQARKIGVCFEQGKLGKIPNEPHDIPLDAIITETAIYQA